MNMVQRVAKAIHENLGYETPWETCTQCESAARAVLEEMKGLDTPMINAGFDALESAGSDGIDCVICFTAMIDAALQEPTK